MKKLSKKVIRELNLNLFDFFYFESRYFIYECTN